MLHVTHNHKTQDGVLIVNVEVHQTHSATDMDASHKRAALVKARKHAQSVAQVMSSDIRTTGRAAGGTINAWGMSNFELAGATG